MDQGEKKKKSHEFDAWAGRLPPALRAFLLAIVPAVFVFITEEASKRPPAPPAPVEAAPKKVEASIEHAFTEKDLDKLSSAAERSILLTQNLDLYMTRPLVADEMICMQGLRHGAYAFVANALSAERQTMYLSMQMRNVRDEKYVLSQMHLQAQTALASVQSADVTIERMRNSCAAYSNISTKTNEIKSFMDGSAVPLLQDIASKTVLSR